MDDVILALSFGKPEDIAPNRTIARLARQLSDGGEIPIVADNSVPMDTSISVSYIGAEVETHVSTLKLMEEFVGLLKEKRWHRIVIVSEPSYLIRCERDLKKVLGKNAWKYQISLYVYSDGGDCWFDKNSTQWWIRSRGLFRLREVVIQLLPFWLYKLIS